MPWIALSLLALSVLMLSALPSVPAVRAASAPTLPPPLTRQLRIAGIPSDHVSLYLRQVSSPRPALALNEQVPRNPASVMKLLTTFVALDILGPAYTWPTEAYVRGSLKRGRLHGDLILKGYGDPYLTPEAFWKFVWGLRQRGLEVIDGDVVLDDSFFDTPLHDRGDFDGQPHRVYNALPHPLSISFQAVQLHLIPDRPAGRVRVFSDPPLANLTIRNELELVPSPCQGPNRWPELDIHQGPSGATVKLRGNYSSACPESTLACLVMDPASHAGGAFSALWRDLGGRLEGKVRSGGVPFNAVLFHSMESRPLGEVIRAMNKYSNNLMSELLLLTMAAERHGQPGTVESGRVVLRDWLHAQGLDFPELVLDNGSGLSRAARVAAKSVGQLLLTAYESPYMPEFMASLAIAGVDGTVRRRVRNQPVAGRAHIKTGSLDGVSTMAGYVLGQDGDRWIVVLLVNHEGITPWQGARLQDALLTWVAGLTGSPANAHPKIAIGPKEGCGPTVLEHRSQDDARSRAILQRYVSAKE